MGVRKSGWIGSCNDTHWNCFNLAWCTAECSDVAAGHTTSKILMRETKILFRLKLVRLLCFKELKI